MYNLPLMPKSLLFVLARWIAGLARSTAGPALWPADPVCLTAGLAGRTARPACWIASSARGTAGPAR